MKNILVLTDFSNPSYEALFYITGLYKHEKATFHILNAYTEHTPLKSPSVGDEGKSLSRQLRDEALEGLEAMAHRIRLDRNNAMHSIKIKAVKNHLPEAVLSFLSKETIELVVMGNKGISSRKGVFFGSNVLRILKKVEKAVLAVPEGIPDKNPNEIAFALSYDRTYSREVLFPLIELATLSSAAVRLLHLNDEERLSPTQIENLNSLKKRLGELPVTLHWMPDFRKKADAIHSFISKKGIGMLSMVHHPHGFLASMMQEDVIRNVQFIIEVPFLILPQTE